MAPVALGVDVPEIEARLLSQRDLRRGAGDLARDERPPATRALVVE